MFSFIFPYSFSYITFWVLNSYGKILPDWTFLLWNLNNCKARHSMICYKNLYIWSQYISWKLILMVSFIIRRHLFFSSISQHLVILQILRQRVLLQNNDWHNSPQNYSTKLLGIYLSHIKLNLYIRIPRLN